MDETKSDYIEHEMDSGDAIIVRWEEKYTTGIEVIDNQHKQLILLTNQLYQACLAREQTLETAFKDALKRMVEYVHFHFSAEEEILQRIKFPNYADHKKQHTDLVKRILEASKNFEKGERFVANRFVITLKDWVFGHIGFYDRIYSSYVAEQKKKGLLSDRQITG